MKKQIRNAIAFILLFSPFPAISFKADTTYINSLLKKSLNLQIESDVYSSFMQAKKALFLAEKIQYKTGIGTASQRLGSLYFLKNNKDSAVWFLKKALVIREESKNFKGAVASCIMLKYVYTNAAEYDKAFDVLFRALRNCNKTRDSASLAEIYLELGNLYIDYNDFSKARDYLTQAESIARKIKDEQTLIQVSSALGNFYYNNNNPRQALSYFLEAEKLNKSVSDRRMLAPTYNNIALCYEQLNRYSDAIHYYNKGLKVYLNYEMRYDEGNTYFNIATMYIHRGMPDSAIFYLNTSLKISKEIKDLKHETLCNEYLSDAYALKKDFAKAYQFHLIYSTLNDSLLNQEKVSSISEMQTKYETEKKEQQIVLLDSQNKTKSAQRNIFVVATLLFLLLAIAILVGLLKTRKEKKISEALLLNILPAEVADELKQKGSADAQFFDEVTVLFTDIKDFTSLAERLTPNELVDLLHICFKAFDNIITKHRIEKIKTIGDSYMCAGGLPVPNKSNASDVVQAGLEIQEFMKTLMEQRIKEGKEPIEIRLGIHTGPVVAGIVGVKKFAYDIWGDTVNLASRMEQSGAIGKVNISETTYDLIKEKFICTPRGKIEAKHKGLIEMYFVERRI